MLLNIYLHWLASDTLGGPQWTGTCPLLADACRNPLQEQGREGGVGVRVEHAARDAARDAAELARLRKEIQQVLVCSVEF
jgi:hypothetical protein